MLSLFAYPHVVLFSSVENKGLEGGLMPKLLFFMYCIGRHI